MNYLKQWILSTWQIRFLLILSSTLCFLSSPLISIIQAGEPDSFHYGVTFTDDKGNPLQLNRKLHSVTFKLWSDLIGGSVPGYEEN